MAQSMSLFILQQKTDEASAGNRNVAITKELLEELGNFLGKDNVKVVEKSL